MERRRCELGRTKPGEPLRELRFDLDRNAHRIAYFYAGEQRIVLLTVFRKQRMNERPEVNRAHGATKRCIEEQHTAGDD